MIFIITYNGTFVEKMGALVGNSILVAGIDLIYNVIMLKVLNFLQISDETPNFYGNLVI
jgi:hypothetical protein